MTASLAPTPPNRCFDRLRATKETLQDFRETDCAACPANFAIETRRPSRSSSPSSSSVSSFHAYSEATTGESELSGRSSRLISARFSSIEASETTNSTSSLRQILVDLLSDVVARDLLFAQEPVEFTLRELDGLQGFAEGDLSIRGETVEIDQSRR